MALTILYWVYTILSWAIYIYMIMMAVYVLMTWLPGALNSAFGQLLGRFVEPVLGLVDRIIPSIMGISFSPIIVFAVLALIRRGLDYLYWALATRLV